MDDEQAAHERRLAIIRQEAERAYVLVRRTEEQAEAWRGSPAYQQALAEIMDKTKRAAIEAAIYARKQ
jgi:hypothetical protein